MNPRKDYQKALELRLQGKTYGEIRSLFGIPKSTQSGWFKDLKLSTSARKTLLSKQKIGLHALKKFNEARTLAIGIENESVRKNFENLIQTLIPKNLAIIGAVLYWGEGQKVFSDKRGYFNPYINFSNSDPMMISIFIKFLEKILNIPKTSITPCVMIHPNISPESAINFWVNLTGIPKENFRCYKSISRASRGKRPKHLLPHGTLQLRVNGRREFFKIRGLIDGIVKAV